MSYIRFTQPRQYSDGESDSYVYDSGRGVISVNGLIPNEDWVEMMAHMIERLDLPEAQKAQTIEAVVDYYLSK